MHDGMPREPIQRQGQGHQSLKVTIPSIFTARRKARIASAVLALATPSVCLSVCLSVRMSVCPSVCHTPVLCQNDGT